MKGKSQKGITLVALIITIIVLLILAVVAISAVSGDGILRHAQNSADQYNAAQIKENTILSNYLDYINKHNPNGGTTNPPEEVSWYVTEGKGRTLFFIGDVEELELTNDTEVKAYLSTFNEDTEEDEYDENSEIITVKLSEMEEESICLFEDNCSVEKLTLGAGMDAKTSIDSVATNIILLDGFASIPKAWMKEDSTLKSITIPSSVTSIGSNAFYGCSNLTITVVGKTEAEAIAAWGAIDNWASGVKEIKYVAAAN